MFAFLETTAHRNVYLGWYHDGVDERTPHSMLWIKKRMDEAFVVVGMDLVKIIAGRRYCDDRNACDVDSELYDTDFGGVSLGLWLNAPDIKGRVKQVRINDKVVDIRNNKRQARFADGDSKNVRQSALDCGTYFSYHTIKNLSLLYQFHAVAKKGVLEGTQGAPPPTIVDAGQRLPIYHLHIPKCGSSFQTMVLLMACPGVTHGELQQSIMMHPDDIKTLPWFTTRGCAFTRFANGHEPMLSTTLLSRPTARVVTMLRQPTVRTVSGLQHNFHDCFPLQEELGAREYDGRRLVSCSGDEVFYESNGKGTSARGKHPLTPEIALRYAMCVKGCMINMMNGKWCGTQPFTKPHPPHHIPTDAETAVAVTAVAEFGMPASQIAFVGITDRWRDTITLFGHLFGVSNVAALDHLLLANNNAAPNRNCAATVEKVLATAGWTKASDAASLALYNAAGSRFDELLTNAHAP